MWSKNGIFGIFFVLPVPISCMDMARAEETVQSYPTVIAAQAIIAHKDVGAIIAQYMLKPEIRAFVMKRLSVPEIRLERYSCEQVIPFIDGMIGLVASQKVQLWSTKSVERMGILEPEMGDQLCVIPNKKGDKALITNQKTRNYRGPTVQIWSVTDGVCIRVIYLNKDEEYRYIGFCNNEDDEMLVAASSKSVQKWSIETGALLTRFEDPQAKIIYAEVDPRGMYAFIVLQGEHPFLWSLEENKKVHIFTKLQPWAPVRGYFSPNGAILIASTNLDIQLYSVPSGADIAIISNRLNSATKIAWSADSKVISIVAEHISALWKFDAPRGAFSEHFLLCGGKTAQKAVFNKRGNKIIVAFKNSASIQNLQTTKREERYLVGHKTTIESLGFSDDGSRAYTLFC